MSSLISFTESESEVAQSCPTLSDPMDCSPPGSSVHGIFQAGTLEWVAKNEKSEREIKESIPFTFATKRIKYPGINLPKKTKELYKIGRAHV